MGNRRRYLSEGVWIDCGMRGKHNRELGKQRGREVEKHKSREAERQRRTRRELMIVMEWIRVS